MPSAGSTVTFVVTRTYPRLRMRLPVCLRWTSPLAQKIELAETNGRFARGMAGFGQQLPAPGVALCVTFPYDASLREGQPEVPRVWCTAGRARLLCIFRCEGCAFGVSADMPRASC